MVDAGVGRPPVGGGVMGPLQPPGEGALEACRSKGGGGCNGWARRAKPSTFPSRCVPERFG